MLTNALHRLFEVDRHPLRPVSREQSAAAGIVTEQLVFDADGEAVRGFLTRPETESSGPAILYIHAHGGAYHIGASELLDGRPALQGPLGRELAVAGYATLAIDMPGFGLRTHASESALAKARLWHGRSLAGQLVGEQASALGWLAAQPFVDAKRIGCFGISMGATLGYWLSAVDARLSCVAHLCCFADFDALIEAGAHDRHSIYLTVPGLLDVASNGVIAGLIAPRPQLICIGDLDPLTPPLAVDRALAEIRRAYAASPEQLVLVRDPDTGHVETPAMRQAVMKFFRGNLG